MPMIAEAERTISGPIETVFSRFIDYRSWAEWGNDPDTPIMKKK